MKLLDTKSLAATIDAVNDALFFERRIPSEERRRVAKWIAARQGQPESYAGMFAPTPDDLAKGFRVFTGERISSRVGTRHVLGEEACRALRLLKVDTLAVGEALKRATGTMDRQLSGYEEELGNCGFY